MSHTKVLIHAIYRTKYSEETIDHNKAIYLYKYIWKILQSKNCVLLRINGMPDHVHIFFQIHQSIALADLMRDIKSNSSKWVKDNDLLPDFKGWASEYAAFSYSDKDKQMIINYIKNQHEHHKITSFQDEIRELYEEFGLTDKLQYFFKD
jgi:putative transposase